MVGVPGKYKGCNTCRRRRVRCDMTRPACKKCEDSGRECGGYERDLTFIVGTPAEKGRCSSHPHRSILKENQNQQSKKVNTPPKRRVTPTTVTSVADSWTTPSPAKESELGGSSSFIFVHTPSLHFDPHYENNSASAFTLPSLTATLPYINGRGASHLLSICGFAFVEDNDSRCSDDGDSNPRSRKKAHLRSSPTSAPRQDERFAEARTLYIFQASTEPCEEEPTFEHILGGTPDQMKMLGPTALQDSPVHQFFARLWRPLAITNALQNETKIFLEQQHWLLGPFESVDKSSFDLLWDAIAKLPGICERGRRTVATTAGKVTSNYQRSLKARDLLNSCLGSQKELDQWLRVLTGSGEGSNFCPTHWTLPSSPQGKGNRRRSSPNQQASPSPRHGFRDAEAALLLVNYWAAVIVFNKMVGEVLIVAEPTQDSNGSSQLPYRPSAGASPAYNSSSPQASISSISATSPPANIDASEHNAYGVATTEGYAYYSTTETSFNPQYAPNIFVAQQQTPYMAFSTDTYPTTTGYAPVTTYAPDPGFTNFTAAYNTNMSSFPAQSNNLDFSNLEYLNVDTSYLPGVGSNGAGGMDYLPPPQRNPTPASYISAPGSHHSPANSWVSAASSAAASVHPFHAATPPDHNEIVADGRSFNTPGGAFASLYQNSRMENLKEMAKMIGSGLDFLLNQDTNVDVVLLLWPLEVLEAMCSDMERHYCSELRLKLQRKSEETGRWVRSRRWKAVGSDEVDE